MTSPQRCGCDFYCEPAIPAFLTMSPQRTTSDLTKLRISPTDGVAIGNRLSFSICAFISGSAITATISLCSLSTTGCGVLAGAQMVNQPATSKPGTPASLSGGTSANALTRTLVETPIARTLTVGAPPSSG